MDLRDKFGRFYGAGGLAMACAAIVATVVGGGPPAFTLIVLLPVVAFTTFRDMKKGNPLKRTRDKPHRR